MADDFYSMLMQQLQTYSSEIQAGVDKEAEKTARHLRKLLKENSPKKTGEYAAGWTVKKYDNGTHKAFVVKNKNKPMLAPLLEFGHTAYKGTRRMKAYPHIAPARAQAQEEFSAAVEKIIEEKSK